MIVVIDYGMGNLHSVRKALEVVGARAKVSSRPEDIEKARKIVFPGVGSFGEAMKELKRLELIEPIKNVIARGGFFLGLCLGLQLLFEESEEAPGVKGLCVLKGKVRRFSFKEPGARGKSPVLKIPHMGWNNIAYSSKLKAQSSKIFKGIPNDSYMYFVHSYYVKSRDQNVILTTTDYGIRFTSGICKDNVYGFQFHPEKSQGLGLKILKNFVKL